jgi:hypothetical protein
MDDQYTHPMTRTLQVAWAAGFLDGEGCFALSKANGKGCHETTKNAVLAVSQTRTAPLDRLAELFGGTVRPARMTAAGNLNYQWAITGSQLVPVLEELIQAERGQSGTRICQDDWSSWLRTDEPLDTDPSQGHHRTSHLYTRR